MTTPQHAHPDPCIHTGDVDGVSYFCRGEGDKLECDYMRLSCNTVCWTRVSTTDKHSSPAMQTAARLAREHVAKKATPDLGAELERLKEQLAERDTKRCDKPCRICGRDILMRDALVSVPSPSGTDETYHQVCILIQRAETVERQLASMTAERDRDANQLGRIHEAFVPVLGWYQPAEGPKRSLCAMAADAVRDLMHDRKELNEARATIERQRAELLELKGAEKQVTLTFDPDGQCGYPGCNSLETRLCENAALGVWLCEEHRGETKDVDAARVGRHVGGTPACAVTHEAQPRGKQPAWEPLRKHDNPAPKTKFPACAELKRRHIHDLSVDAYLIECAIAELAAAALRADRIVRSKLDGGAK
jgi:hypothetical protein